ncbi:MAG: viroplasmin family protein [Patescibacteria group bacterium]
MLVDFLFILFAILVFIMKEAIAFCDGASLGNPGRGGWGAVILEGGKVKEIGGRALNVTNNAMELTAAIGALHAITSWNVTIHSDSRYVIRGISEWVSLWEESGWRTKAKKPVENQLLWKKLISEVGKKKEVKWVHVAGHSGIHGNERADVIASSFASGKNTTLFIGPKENYFLDILDISPNAQKSTKRKKDRSRSSVPAYSYISVIKGKVQLHKTWKECEARVKGISGARFKKSFNREDEALIVKEFSK